ncbi:MAG: tripartite tricarboxylate transporter TctB family protein [Rhodospirillales bacterium]
MRLKSAFPVLAVTVLGFGWAVWMLQSTLADKYGGAESVLLIEPLVWLLGGAGLLVIIEMLTGRTDDREDTGLADPRRLSLLAAMILYALALPFLGFVIASALFSCALAAALGLRGYWLILIPVISVALILGFFSFLLGLRLPLWPVFLTGGGA